MGNLRIMIIADRFAGYKFQHFQNEALVFSL
jgi:hypothetical protein